MSKSRQVYPVPGFFLLGVPAVPMVREDHAALVESGAFTYEPPEAASTQPDGPDDAVPSDTTED